ncbi:MAG: hypothetical protein ABSH46_11105 [Bryobacteraceae bacterium]|jgi:hypothetical protein
MWNCFGLFRPKWQHTDAKVRQAAVKKLHKQKTLASIAKYDKDSDVCAAAVENLTDQAILVDLAENGYYETVRGHAVRNPHLADQAVLARIAKSGSRGAGWTSAMETACWAAVGKLTDQALLVEIAKNRNHTARSEAASNRHLTDEALLAELATKDEDSSVRVHAVRNPNLTDQALLAHAAKNDENPWVRSSAVERLTDQVLLVEIAKNGEEGESVRKAAAEKLNDRSLAQEVNAEIAKDREDRRLRKVAEVERLTAELYRVGWCDGFLSATPGGKFDDHCRNLRAREIGERLNDLGGFRLMTEAHSTIQQRQGPARQLESCWGGIGSWEA